MLSQECPLMGALINQFEYYLLIWMNHSREFNNKINRIHERALRIVYSDNKSTYVERLEKDHSITIHTKNLQVLITEMFKLQNETSATIRSSYQMCSIKKGVPKISQNSQETPVPESIKLSKRN